MGVAHRLIIRAATGCKASTACHTHSGETASEEGQDKCKAKQQQRGGCALCCWGCFVADCAAVLSHSARRIKDLDHSSPQLLAPVHCSPVQGARSWGAALMMPDDDIILAINLNSNPGRLQACSHVQTACLGTTPFQTVPRHQQRAPARTAPVKGNCPSGAERAPPLCCAPILRRG